MMWEGKGIVLLLRTLLERPHLRNLVRIFVISSPIDYELGLQNTAFKTVQASRGLYLSPFDQRILDMFDFADLDEISDEFKAAETVCATVLCLLPRLESLHLLVPDDRDRYSTFYDSLAAALGDPDLRPHILPSVSQLCLRADLRRRTMRAEVDSVLFQLPGLRKLEMLGDCLSTRFLYGQVDPKECWQQLEEIKLDSSHTLGRGWNAICSRASRLKRIIIHLSPRVEREDGDDTERFNSALVKCSKTLEFIHVTSLGLLDDGRLSCLPKLCKLKDLMVEMFLLYESRSDLGKYRLADLLPASIVNLDLIEEWGERGDEEESPLTYRVDIKNIL